MLTREQIIGAEDLGMVKLAVPEWGGDVFIKSLDGESREAMEAAIDKHRDEKGRLKSLTVYRAVVSVHVVCDAQGCRLFADDAIPALMRKSAKALERISSVASRLNSLGEDELEAALKNCGIPHGCGFGSNLPTAGDAVQPKPGDESAAAT
jgi:hypothetical protein